MKLIIDISESRYKDIQRIAEVQIDRRFDTAEQIIAKGIPLEQEPTGHWIEDTNGTYTDNHDTWECSQCGHVQILLEGTPKDNDYNYCPNCGCAMIESQAERSGV